MAVSFLTYVCADARPTSRPLKGLGSGFAEGAVEIIRHRLDQIDQRRAVGGLDECLDRHSGDQDLTLRQFFLLAGVQHNLGPVIAGSDRFILKRVGRNQRDLAHQFRCGALIKRREAQVHILPRHDLVDMDRVHAGRDHKRTVLWYQEENRIGTANNRAHGLHPHPVDNARDWRPNFHLVDLGQKGEALFDQFNFARAEVTQTGDRLFAPLAGQAQGLDLNLCNALFCLGLGGRQFAKPTLQRRRFALQRQDTTRRGEATLKQALLYFQFLLDQLKLSGQRNLLRGDTHDLVARLPCTFVQLFGLARDGFRARHKKIGLAIDQFAYVGALLTGGQQLWIISDFVQFIAFRRKPSPPGHQLVELAFNDREARFHLGHVQLDQQIAREDGIAFLDLDLGHDAPGGVLDDLAVLIHLNPARGDDSTCDLGLCRPKSEAAQ
mmetsp:Transcript_29655/g.58693  ORF Transcript_29655/g.58693 Transcript_29655/m.58693 type:complete len:437 (+) Transcript_29655:681-1991(+)